MKAASEIRAVFKEARTNRRADYDKLSAYAIERLRKLADEIESGKVILGVVDDKLEISEVAPVNGWRVYKPTGWVNLSLRYHQE